MSERTINLTLTEDEAVALRNLLNAAVMARGMQVAEAALVIDRKIIQAGQEIIQQKDNGNEPESDD